MIRIVQLYNVFLLIADIINHSIPTAILTETAIIRTGIKISTHLQSPAETLAVTRAVSRLIVHRLKRSAGIVPIAIVSVD